MVKRFRQAEGGKGVVGGVWCVVLVLCTCDSGNVA